jgi:hypothetical protein
MLLALHGLLGLVALVCFIMVVVKMIQTGNTLMGVLCIVGVFLCGIGGLAAFILGWMNVNPWKIKNVMIAWTVAMLVDIVLVALNPSLFSIPGR